MTKTEFAKKFKTETKPVESVDDDNDNLTDGQKLATWMAEVGTCVYNRLKKAEITMALIDETPMGYLDNDHSINNVETYLNKNIKKTRGRGYVFNFDQDEIKHIFDGEVEIRYEEDDNEHFVPTVFLGMVTKEKKEKSASSKTSKSEKPKKRLDASADSDIELDETTSEQVEYDFSKMSDDKLRNLAKTFYFDDQEDLLDKANEELEERGLDTIVYDELTIDIGNKKAKDYKFFTDDDIKNIANFLGIDEGISRSKKIEEIVKIGKGTKRTIKIPILYSRNIDAVKMTIDDILFTLTPNQLNAALEVVAHPTEIKKAKTQLDKAKLLIENANEIIGI